MQIENNRIFLSRLFPPHIVIFFFTLYYSFAASHEICMRHGLELWDLTKLTRTALDPENGVDDTWKWQGALESLLHYSPPALQSRCCYPAVWTKLTTVGENKLPWIPAHYYYEPISYWKRTFERWLTSSATSFLSTCYAFCSMVMDWLRWWCVFLSRKDVSQFSSLFIEVDPIQLESPLPPIPKPCDHNPESCNRCWKGYPQSLFPQWTEQQIRKAKIYEAIHNSPRNKFCTCYQLDVNMQGFFTNAGKITAAYGDEDLIWDQMIYEQVSWSYLFLYEPSILISETTRYTTESLVHPRFVWTGSSDVGHKVVSIFYLPSVLCLSNNELRYNIEPFFWSSSFNWIPSQFQDDVRPGIGDRESGMAPGLRA